MIVTVQGRARGPGGGSSGLRAGLPGRAPAVQAAAAAVAEAAPPWGCRCAPPLLGASRRSGRTGTRSRCLSSAARGSRASLLILAELLATCRLLDPGPGSLCPSWEGLGGRRVGEVVRVFARTGTGRVYPAANFALLPNPRPHPE